MSIIGNETLAGAAGQGGYFLDNSLRFRSSASAYLSWTPASAGNRKTWTWSGWVKKSNSQSGMLFSYYASGADNNYLYFGGDIIRYKLEISNVTTEIITNAVFRDPSSWYHIVLAIDTTQATASNRTKLYVNGSQITSFSTASYPAQNTNSYLNSGFLTTIGGRSDLSGPLFYEGYLTEINFIDGQALDPTDFGEFDEDTGVWKPKEYEGTYGTNGFYLDGSGVTDSSGNGNNWTNNNLNLTTSSATTYDLMTDVPTLTDENTANYSTINALIKDSTTTISNGNLSFNGSTTWDSVFGTIVIPTTGKWYWELNAGSAQSTLGIVVSDANFMSAATTYPGNGFESYTYYGANGNKYSGPVYTATSYGATFGAGDIVGIAFDADAGTLVFYKNNVSQGTAFTGLTKQYVPIFGVYNTASDSANFGQRPFAYTPPTGFKALNTYNLPDSTIVDGLDHFEATTYSGTSARRDVSLQKFNPSFIWTKARNTAYNHFLYNEVVGTSTHLSSNLTSASQGNNGLVAFSPQTADFGYDLTSGQINETGKTYVSWNWKANGSGVSNSEGDITVTVSADTTSGFSIVKGTYTGVASSQTFGHGLGATPAMIITKDISGASNFGIWHETYGATSGNTQIMIFNTNATLSAGNYMGTVSSTLSSVSSGLIVNGNDFVQWIWTEVEGFSAFGSYTGNGSADGPFIYTGFRPAWIMVKRTDSADNWWMQDNARDPYNVAKHYLSANTNNAEFSNLDVYDYTANGFKIRTTTTAVNASGSTYIYAAFAENPFKNSLAR